jgi:hypothetical protein
MKTTTTKKKSTTESCTLEMFQHSDGRRWVRLNGRLITPTLYGASLQEIASLIYRKLRTTIAEAAKQLTSCTVIEVTHPQFVQPYQFYTSK